MSEDGDSNPDGSCNLSCSAVDRHVSEVRQNLSMPRAAVRTPSHLHLRGCLCSSPPVPQLMLRPPLAVLEVEDDAAGRASVVSSALVRVIEDRERSVS